MYGIELESLAAVHRHEPDGVHVERDGGYLSQFTFLCEQYQLPHAFECPLDRDAVADGRLLADEVQELPQGNSFHALGHAVGRRQFRKSMDPIQQIGRQEIPRVGSLGKCLQISGQLLQGAFRLRGYSWDFGNRPKSGQNWMFGMAQIARQQINVLQRNVVPRKRGDARQPTAERIGCQTQQREQIANLFTLEETAKVQHRDTARFQPRRDLVQPQI